MITAKLIRDTETRTTDVMIHPTTGEVSTKIETERIVRLRLDGAPVMVTGQERDYRYRPDMLTLAFEDGKLSTFQTRGYGIRADGSTGRALQDDRFTANGERQFFRRHGAAPAEIMDIVRRYAA